MPSDIRLVGAIGDSITVGSILNLEEKPGKIKY